MYRPICMKKLCVLLALGAGCATGAKLDKPSGLDGAWPDLLEVWQAGKEVDSKKTREEKGAAYVRFVELLHETYSRAGLYEVTGNDEFLVSHLLTKRQEELAQGAFAIGSDDFFYRGWKHIQWHIMGAYKDFAQLHREIDRYFFNLTERDPDRYGETPSAEEKVEPKAEDPRHDLLEKIQVLKEKKWIPENATVVQEWRIGRLYQALEAGESYPDPTPDPKLVLEVSRLVKELSSPELEVREAAGRKLVELGEPAIAPLAENLKSADAETEARIRWILHPNPITPPETESDRDPDRY